MRNDDIYISNDGEIKKNPPLSGRYVWISDHEMIWILGILQINPQPFIFFFFTSLLSKVSYKSKRHRGTKLRFRTKIMNPIVPKIERQYKFKVKLNDYQKNLHKIKSMELIRLCIGQIDLIVGPIKGLIKFKN
jgi:hypothetical protein